MKSFQMDVNAWNCPCPVIFPGWRTHYRAESPQSLEIPILNAEPLRFATVHNQRFLVDGQRRWRQLAKRSESFLALNYDFDTQIDAIAFLLYQNRYTLSLWDLTWICQQLEAYHITWQELEHSLTRYPQEAVLRSLNKTFWDQALRLWRELIAADPELEELLFQAMMHQNFTLAQAQMLHSWKNVEDRYAVLQLMLQARFNGNEQKIFVRTVLELQRLRDCSWSQLRQDLQFDQLSQSWQQQPRLFAQKILKALWVARNPTRVKTEKHLEAIIEDLKIPRHMQIKLPQDLEDDHFQLVFAVDNMEQWQQSQQWMRDNEQHIARLLHNL